ncbi:MAG: uroporphyrinogen decarboxylase family protein, partial [Bacteroidota bacterium]
PPPRRWTPSHYTTLSRSLQGNLDPCQLYAEPGQVAQATTEMLKAYGGQHIANLGHGVYPDTPLDGVRAFIKAVQDFRY